MSLSSPVLEQTNEEPLQALKRGSSDAFERIMDATRGLVYGAALRITRVREEAEDVLQETYLRLWTHRVEVEDVGGWLRRVATNLSLDRVRRRKREQEKPPPVPSEPQEAKALPNDRLQEALNRLDPERQEVFILRIFGGLSYREIALKVGISLGTVMSRLHRARRDLYHELKDEVQ